MAKLLRSLFRVVWAALVFGAVCLAWLILFLVFAPFLLIGEIIRLLKPTPSTDKPIRVSVKPSPGDPLIFDRRHDVSDRKSTRLNSSHLVISYAVFCLKKKTI